MELFNAKELKSQMRSLKISIQKQILRAMVRAGATIIRKSFKRNLRKHRRTKMLESAVAVKVSMYKGVAIGMAGIRKDKVGVDKYGNKVVPANYNHLVELGRKGFMRRFKVTKPTKGGPIPYRDGKPRYIPAARGKYPLGTAIQDTKAEVKLKLYEVFKRKVEEAIAKQINPNET